MNFGVPELLIVLAISALLFGTKKIRSLGSDFGGALRGFRKAMNEEEEPAKPLSGTAGTAGNNKDENNKDGDGDGAKP